tara:strand:+ start:101 stop:469 length:369 start_codon:yes stop_codon:yes gene_type:complete
MPFIINNENIDTLYKIEIYDYTDVEFCEFIKNYKKIIQSEEKKIKIIFDASKLSRITIKQITKLSLFLLNMKKLHKKNLEKFTIIVVNNLIREIIDIVFKIIPPVRPYKIVKNIEDAYSYIL